MPLTMKVKDIMDPKLVSIDRVTPGRQALQKMIDTGTESVIVTDGGRIVGMMSQRDFITRCVLKGLDPDRTPVEDLMTTPLLTIDGERTIGEALETMLAKNIRRLYVTKEGEIVGRITQTRLLDKMLDVFVAISSLQAGI